MYASAYCKDGTNVNKIWHRMDAGGINTGSLQLQQGCGTAQILGVNSCSRDVGGHKYWELTAAAGMWEGINTGS